MKRTEDKDASSSSDTFRMLLACAALVLFFLIYGVFQERLMTIPYGDSGEKFQWSAFLVLNNRLVCVLVAMGILHYKGESFRNVAPLYKYFYISFSNTIATFCQYESLRYISFPTQTIGKCGKMIPVMMISGILGLKKYQTMDYVSALTISFGCVMFLLGGDIAPQTGQSSDSLFGVMLIFGYLFFDGFTSTFQEKLFKDYTISSYNQMLYVNLTSAILSLTYLMVGEQITSALAFTSKYPSSYAAACILSLAACCGQLVIYYIIKNFGALVFATAMVFRHIVAILLSCILFWHPLTLYQWLAGSLVLGTYYFHSVSKRRSGHSHSQPSQNEDANKEKEKEKDLEMVVVLHNPDDDKK